VRILYVSQYFPPEMGAPAARVSELSKHWTDRGHQVTVLTGFPNHPDGILRPEYRKAYRHLVSRERWNGVSVVRSWLLPYPNRKSYERILNYSSFCASAALTGSFLERPDIVIATSPQLLVGLAGYAIARMQRAPFVFEVRDLWPESLSAVGVAGPHSLLHRALGKLAALLYRRANHIVVVTPAFTRYLVLHWHLASENISLVANGVETKLFAPQAADPGLRRSLGIEGRFVVSFIGTLGLAHGLETLISAAEMLEQIDPGIVFLLVGEGADRERIMGLAKSKQLGNIRFLGPQSREAIPGYISLSDACLVLLKKSQVFETVLPTKMLECMSSARPVIVAVNGQSRDILERSQAGLYVEPENAGALCEAILKLRHQPRLREALGRNGREYIVKNLSREHTATTYLELLHRLTMPKPAETAAAV
jgi:colanic acid biosynthesis glycosyl transferase WcaI